MKIAHKYNWHYAPAVYPEGDVQLWCKWCGFRQTIKKKPRSSEAAQEAVDRLWNMVLDNQALSSLPMFSTGPEEKPPIARGEAKCVYSNPDCPICPREKHKKKKFYDPT